MGLFSKHNTKTPNQSLSNSSFAEMALKAIHDGVIVTDVKGNILFINPAVARMTNCSDISNILNLDYSLLVKIESRDGQELVGDENPLTRAMKTGEILEKCVVNLVMNGTEKRTPVSMSVLPMDNGNKIITFRDVTKELQEENAQSEFIYTASHEMRTPVASIEGFLSLALNPQTATIDERARGYLNTAHDASRHLGKLFQDLLDTTKLDDGRMKPHLKPVDLIEITKGIADSFAVQINNAKLKYNFGDINSGFLGKMKMNQVAYATVDVDFLQEALGNLIDNAIKYTPEGGSITVNAVGEENRILINVTDTGPGISVEDLKHIFQKFYRSDNSQTRTVGGTGLGLYLVKQRIESMGGKVWAESIFGQGSTFYVSFPRISDVEYKKRLIAYQNEQLIAQPTTPKTLPVQPQAVPVVQPLVAQATQPVTQQTMQVSPQIVQASPQPQPQATQQPPTVPQRPMTPQSQQSTNNQINNGGIQQ